MQHERRKINHSDSLMVLAVRTLLIRVRRRCDACLANLIVDGSNHWSLNKILHLTVLDNDTKFILNKMFSILQLIGTIRNRNLISYCDYICSFSSIVHGEWYCEVFGGCVMSDPFWVDAIYSESFFVTTILILNKAIFTRGDRLLAYSVVQIIHDRISFKRKDSTRFHSKIKSKVYSYRCIGSFCVIVRHLNLCRDSHWVHTNERKVWRLINCKVLSRKIVNGKCWQSTHLNWLSIAAVWILSEAILATCQTTFADIVLKLPDWRVRIVRNNSAWLHEDSECLPCFLYLLCCLSVVAPKLNTIFQCDGLRSNEIEIIRLRDCKWSIDSVVWGIHRQVGNRDGFCEAAGWILLVQICRAFQGRITNWIEHVCDKLNLLQF